MSILSLFSPFAWIRRLISLIFLLVLGFFIYCGYLVYSASQLPTSVAGLKPASTIFIVDPASSSTQLSSDTINRLNQAINVYAADPARHVMLVGKGESITFAKEYLLANKIPSRKLKVLPSASLPTAFADLAGNRSLGSGLITVVADALQADYIENIAADNNLKVQISPAINSEGFSLSWLAQLAQESSAVAVGKVIGFTRVDWG
jgi:hypothetical protein